MAARPTICLNMIVRNEAHIVRELLDSVAPYISSWVIVDTGSDDGTQGVIESHMAALGIAGELHERPWRDFGHNRTEALRLAQGHGDYIWVMDADDVVVGEPEFNRMGADVYSMRVAVGPSCTYWRRQLFRDGMPFYYHGVVHEVARNDGPVVHERLPGEYHIEPRQLGARSKDPQKCARDRDLLLAEVERNPADARSVFYLAQSYLALGDFDNARKWYARRVEMGGWPQEVYDAMFKIAEAMVLQGAPWLEAQDAYLQAWEFRPTRAEALYAVACHYRLEKRYQLGHLFAERAASIPYPDEDSLFVNEIVHNWAATGEQAVCAFWIGRHAEAFALCRSLLARRDLPENDRRRIARNRDLSVPAVVEAASSYPDTLASQPRLGPSDSGITVTLVAGPDLGATECTLNSFLNSCLDISRVGRFLVIDAGMSAPDRAALAQRYRFLELSQPGSGTQFGALRTGIVGRFWLHLGGDWRFFAAENLITRLTAVLEVEPQVFQVGINFADAVGLTGACAAEEAVRRAPDAGRYLLTDAVASGPAMFDTVRLDRVGGVQDNDPDPLAALGRRAAANGLQTASLDEVLCIRSDPAPAPAAAESSQLRLPQTQHVSSE